mmetsp:Transcript_54833/g.138537  ORF Transcript_54833/g.138537 Transcript_54833/m.138537 type:complete len:311 (+) Transcript_54833:101-1033(+)
METSVMNPSGDGSLDVVPLSLLELSGNQLQDLPIGVLLICPRDVIRPFASELRLLFVLSKLKCKKIPERCVHDSLLRALVATEVTQHPHAALYVSQAVAGEATPHHRRTSICKASRTVHANHAEPHGVEDLIEVMLVCVAGPVVHNDHACQVAPAALMAEIDCDRQEGGEAGWGVKSNLVQHGRESLVLEAQHRRMGICLKVMLWNLQILMEPNGGLTLPRGPHGSPMLVEASSGPRIENLGRWSRCDLPLHHVEECPTLGPLAASDNDLGSCANVAVIEQLVCDQSLRLGLQVSFAPRDISRDHYVGVD